jgi:8-oxo-dGTP pyrophosphatase MutT (NUDIX family)
MEIPTLLRQKLIQEPPEKLFDPQRALAAVLVPFFQRNGEWHLLFTHRSKNLQHHSNEISFPGGTMEPDDPDLMTTALRELQEEVAIPAASVEILGRLGHWRTVSSSFVVVPYVGMLSPDTQFRANPVEVAELLEVPLRELQNPAIFRQEERLIDQKLYPVYYYEWRSHTIWGLTGRIVKTLLDLLSGGSHD